MSIVLDGTAGITSPGGDTASVSLATPILKSPSSLTLQTNGSTAAVTVDTSQNVGIGTATPSTYAGAKVSIVGAQPQFAIAGGSSTGGQMWILSNGGTSTAAGFGFGQGYSSASDGIAYISNNAAADMIFRTGATERFRLLGASSVLCLAGGSTSATGTGIAFPATQSVSTDANCLDDYEEGTWTPGITFGGGSTGLTYNNRTGWYTKIGNQVTVQFNIFLSAIGSSTGAAVISGLPFTSANDGAKRNGGYGFFDRITPCQILGLQNSTTFSLQTVSSGPGSSATDITQSNFANNTFISASFTYFV